MLTNEQITCVWENLIAAETRALYFGDLATRYTRRKQWITGVSFFFTTGAAAAMVAKMPVWLPLVLNVSVAVAAAYAIALNLDGKIATLVKLRSAWSQIATQYERLWNHTYEPEAEDDLDRILAQEREPSDLAIDAAPNDARLMDKWETHVFAMRHLTPA